MTTEDCTLSGGAETTCYSITVWFDGNEAYDLDGEFFVDPPTIYGDDNNAAENRSSSAWSASPWPVPMPAKAERAPEAAFPSRLAGVQL